MPEINSASFVDVHRRIVGDFRIFLPPAQVLPEDPFFGGCFFPDRIPLCFPSRPLLLVFLVISYNGFFS